MIRSLMTKITGFIAEQSHSPRRKCQLPVRVWFEPIRTPGIHTSTSDNIFLSGETIDLSKTGIAFAVSAIRIRENYLVGQERILNMQIDLPDGPITLQVIGRRYEREEIDNHVEKYIIGAEITRLENEERKRYLHFLRFAGNRRGPASAGVEARS